MGLFNGELSQAIKRVMGDSVREPFLMNLGNPLTGAVEIRLEDGAEMPGLVWVHARTAQNMAISGDTTAPDDDKVTATRALLKPNRVPPEYQLYGTPIYVKENNGVLEIIDLGGIAAVEYLFGVKAHPQRSVDVSQFDYGLIRPTAPTGAKINISPFRPTLDNTAYDVPALESIDLIDTYAGALAVGQARAIMIQVNPVTATLEYAAGSVFTDTTHELAFPSYYPKTITGGRFLLGWVKLYYGITEIGINDIYHAQEIYSKEVTTGGAALDSIVMAAGEFVRSGTDLVRITA